MTQFLPQAGTITRMGDIMIQFVVSELFSIQLIHHNTRTVYGTTFDLPFLWPALSFFGLPWIPNTLIQLYII